MMSRYLEDFAVGQTFQSCRLKIDRERIKTFAAEFDPQPFHLDEHAARETIFGGLTASGWHTAAVTMRPLVDSDLKPAGGIVGAGFVQDVLSDRHAVGADRRVLGDMEGASVAAIAVDDAVFPALAGLSRDPRPTHTSHLISPESRCGEYTSDACP
jgi:MaoC dehydratase-like protein